MNQAMQTCCEGSGALTREGQVPGMAFDRAEIAP